MGGWNEQAPPVLIYPNKDGVGGGEGRDGEEFSCCRKLAAQVSNGTSSSDVVSSDSGMSSTSSSEEEEEEEEEKEGEADRGMELLEEEEDEDGETLKREMLRPSVWKMEAREGLLGGASGLSGGGAGGA